MERKLLFYVGEKFDSFEALSSKLDAYCKSAFVHYWTRDSRKIGCARILRHIDEKLKYYSLKYTCVLGGQAFHSRGTGQRYSFSIRANNCPAYISVRASKDGMHLEVVGVNNEHNHDLSQEFFQALPKERRLPDNIKSEVIDLIKLKVDKRSVQEYVRNSTKKILTTKDITNIVAAGRLESRPEITKERSSELLTKVFSGRTSPQLFKKRCNPNLLKNSKNQGKVRFVDVHAVVNDNGMTGDDFIHLESNLPHSSYDNLPTSTDATDVNTSELYTKTDPLASNSNSSDVIVEDPEHFCITCGQLLPENHKLLQDYLTPSKEYPTPSKEYPTPSKEYEMVDFFNPAVDVGVVEEVVSSVDITNSEECVETELGQGSQKKFVHINQGVVTVEEVDFEDFVTRSMHS